MHKQILIINALIFFFFISSCRTKLSESQRNSKNSMHGEDTGGGDGADGGSEGGGGAAADGGGGAPKEEFVLKHPGVLSEDTSNIYYREVQSTYNEEKKLVSKEFRRYPEFIAVDAKNVSINLMWINKEREERNHFIGAYISRENKPFQEVIPEQIVKWMVLNQKSHVVLWYDSEMTTEEQVFNTQAFISKLIDKVNTENHDLITPKKFQMKDVRALQIVKAYPIAFSKHVPIYTRVNSLRLIAALEKEELDLYNQIPSSAFVYADYTVNPHSFEEVYEKGMPKDGFIGIKSNYGNSACYENSFMIIGNQNIYTLGALRDMLISTSKGIHIDRIKIGNNNYSHWNESFLYGFTREAIFVARVREMLEIDFIQFDEKKDIWEELWRLRNPHSFPFKTQEGTEIYIRDIKHEDPNLTDPKSYIAVIDDKRVTITRQSGHGHTGVRQAPAETLDSVIERVRPSGGGAAKEE